MRWVGLIFCSALIGVLAACVSPTATSAPTATQVLAATNPALASVTSVSTTAAQLPSATLEPSATALPPTATQAPIQAPTQTTLTHTVVAGETLFRIAFNAGITVDALRAANGLTSDIILVGQVLIIPSGGQINNPPPTQGVGITVTIAPAASLTPTPVAPPATTPGPPLWDTDPQALIIRTYSDCCELAPYDGNVYIPEAQVWGDGRIIWISPNGVGGRTLLTGQLSHDQLQDLLQAFMDAGFFTWQSNYQTYLGAAARPTHITVNLTGVRKTVTELMGAPNDYYALMASLRVGAGAIPNPYIPTRGYLTTQLFNSSPGTDPEWPSAAAGFTLDQVGVGRYIEGDALAFAWAQVNKGPNAPVYVNSNGQQYVIMIQIPGLSLNPPPEL